METGIMKLRHLNIFSLIYVATPYSKYTGGIDLAFIDACKLTAKLLQNNLRVYSPIAHGHSIAVHGGIDPLDHSIWLPFDAAMMERCDALIVAKMDGWDKSTGVAHEIDTFCEAQKRIYYVDPTTLEVSVFGEVSV